MIVTHHLQLFGHVVLKQAEQPAWRFPTRKAMALLGYLVRQPYPVPRSELTNLLWGELPDARSRRNLTRELSQLAGQLHSCFQADYHTIHWAPAATIRVDTTAFLELLAPAGPAPTQAMALPRRAISDAWFNRPGAAAIDSARLATAVALYRGEFMAGLYVDGCPDFETWLTREREFWRRQVMEQLELLIAHHALHQQDSQAVAFARRCLELEPWHEEAHHALMILLARNGKRNDALAQYDACRRVLADELGIKPSDETIALHEQIRTNQLPIADLRSQTEPDSPKLTTDNLQFQDWGEAPEVNGFYGRQAELATLERWLVDERCRVVALLGMGGVGKTVLASCLARQIGHQYDVVVWRSLLNAPPLAEIVRACLPLLADRPMAELPSPPNDQLALLHELLRSRRCLLVLDNCESILQPGARAGSYRPGYEDYGQLIRRVGESAHQSCLLLTSREQPLGFDLLAGDLAPVRSLRLAGLDADASQQILRSRGLGDTIEGAASLIARYSGNPLALKIVAETVKELFGGNVDTFLRAEVLIFDDIRDVLDQQWGRLTALEQDILLWLAIAREALTPESLRASLIYSGMARALLAALRSLRRRSLIEQQGSGFTLQNVVMEYVTDHLIELACRELETGCWERFRSHALIQARAKEYVRESQVRLILAPIAARAVEQLGRAGLGLAIQAELARLRERQPDASGYAAGNALNLLIQLGYDLRGYDFSRLSIWQADLRGAQLHNLSFAYADLSGSAFTGAHRTVDPFAWSPDEQLLAAPSSDGEIRLWRVSDWQLVGICAGHQFKVKSLAFSPDSQLLVSGSHDHTIRIWHVGQQRTLLTLRGHTDVVSSVAWSTDGRAIYSGSWDRTVRVWDATSGQTCHILRGHTDEINFVAASADGRLASISADQTIRIWHGTSGLLIHTLMHPTQSRVAVWSPDGTTLASGGTDHLIRLWDTSTWTMRGILQGSTNRMATLAFNVDGTQLAGSGDNQVRLWDTRTAQQQQVLYGHTNVVLSVAWSRDGARLISQGDNTIRMWETRTGQCLFILYSYTDSVLGVAFSPDGSVFASSHTNQAVRLWDTEHWEISGQLGGHSGWITGLSFGPNGDTLASSCFDPFIRFWDVRSGHLLGTLHTHSNRIDALARSPDGAILASGGKDSSIWIWDVQHRRVLHVIEGFDLAITALAFSPDGRLLASGGEDTQIRLWDTHSWQELRVYRGHANTVNHLMFNRSGVTLISGSEDATVRFWRVDTGEQLGVLEGHIGPISALALGCDGARLASGGTDRMLRLWDTTTYEEIHVLPHPNGVNAVTFAPNSLTVVSGCGDGRLRLWDTRTGTCQRILSAPGPYAGMDITGVTGITDEQVAALCVLGAIDEHSR